MSKIDEVGTDPQLPLDHPLAGCEAKLRRAQQNLELLDNEIGAYLDGHREPIPRVGELDADTNQHIRWRFRTIDHPDPILAAVIGDYIHDLRSALDHLAFELSFLDTGGRIPSRRVAFPCCWTRAEWRDRKVQVGKLGGINNRHRALIYRAQPCFRRNDTASARAIAARRPNALSDLQNLWDHDKHRTLQPIASAPFDVRGTVADIRDCEPLGDLRLNREILGRPIQNGAEIFSLRIRPTGRNPEVDMDFQVGVLVTFHNGMPALDILPRLGKWVANAIAFWAGKFEGPRARRLWGLPRGGWIEETPVRMKTTIVKRDPGGGWIPAA